MPQRNPEEAIEAMATEQFVKDGVIHEDAMRDASEMALDGCSVKSMAEQRKLERAEAYRPEGGLSVRGYEPNAQAARPDFTPSGRFPV